MPGKATEQGREGEELCTRQKTPFCRETVGPARYASIDAFIVAAGEQVLADRLSRQLCHTKPTAKCKWPLLVGRRWL